MHQNRHLLSDGAREFPRQRVDLLFRLLGALTLPSSLASANSPRNSESRPPYAALACSSSISPASPSLAILIPAFWSSPSVGVDL
jgi:hypothetical protein